MYKAKSIQTSLRNIDYISGFEKVEFHIRMVKTGVTVISDKNIFRIKFLEVIQCEEDGGSPNWFLNQPLDGSTYIAVLFDNYFF